MRKGFTESATEIVTIQRGGEQVQFKITAPPTGYGVALRACLPDSAFVKGKETQLTGADLTERNDLYSFALLAKALEQDGCIESVAPATSSNTAAWLAYAKAVRDEFRAALLTDGDVSELLAAVWRVGKQSNPIREAEEALGN